MRTEIKFSINKFRQPDAVYWPGYFWMWTGPLDVDVLLEQLRDMKEHDALSVCTLPMPKKFRPDSTNNQMDPDYLTPEFFERVKVVVEEAGRLGMNYWLYDEGGWPSGEACGQVTKGHPELQASAMSLGEDGNWHEQKVGTADRLNPKATERFINLTHDGYKAAVGRYFGERSHSLSQTSPARVGCAPTRSPGLRDSARISKVGLATVPNKNWGPSGSLRTN